MRNVISIGLTIALSGLLGCAGEPATDGSGGPDSASNAGSMTELVSTGGAPVEGDWSTGDTIPSGKDGVPAIQILQLHKNGSGERCGTGKTATLAYKAMKANGEVLDPGTRPFSFRVGSGRAIAGWDVVVAQMRIGDSFTILMPQQLAYGPSEGDLKFDMELLSVR